MRILIVSATRYEISPLLKILDFKNKENQNLYECYAFDNTVHVLITGIGMVSTSYYFTKVLKERSYDFVLNIGICGSFNKEIPVGSLVRITNDTIADMGIEDHNDFIPASQWLTNAELPNTIINATNSNHSLFKAFNSLREATGITVNAVSGCTDTIDKRIHIFNPDVESMEGAAFLSICNKENLFCEQVRSVSNFIEPRNEKAWNIPLAIKNLNDFIFHFLKNDLNILV